MLFRFQPTYVASPHYKPLPRWHRGFGVRANRRQLSSGLHRSRLQACNKTKLPQKPTVPLTTYSPDAWELPDEGPEMM